MFGIFRKPMTGTRYADGEWVGGFWQEGEEEPLEFTASVQPASQLDMQLLPEGRRLTGSYRLYTDATLRAAREGTSQQADRVTINGEAYEVMAEMPWQNSIINHNAYLVSRMIQNDSENGE